jgi:hypothetical protein
MSQKYKNKYQHPIHNIQEVLKEILMIQMSIHGNRSTFFKLLMVHIAISVENQEDNRYLR